MRIAKITRKTNETDIAVSLNLDGLGQSSISTGVGFFDHMLEQISKHAMIDLDLTAKGDLHVDAHHTVEDCGIVFGQALAEALNDKAGINRYGACLLPMDDSLVEAALDLSGRPYLVCSLSFPTAKIGQFDTELVREFFQAVATHSAMTLHISMRHGLNSHHIAEAAFKAFARALRHAVEQDARAQGALPTTKGLL